MKLAVVAQLCMATFNSGWFLKACDGGGTKEQNRTID